MLSYLSGFTELFNNYTSMLKTRFKLKKNRHISVTNVLSHSCTGVSMLLTISSIFALLKFFLNLIVNVGIFDRK